MYTFHLLFFCLYSRCALEDSEAEMRFIFLVQLDYRYKDYNNKKKVYESVFVCVFVCNYSILPDRFRGSWLRISTKNPILNRKRRQVG